MLKSKERWVVFLVGHLTYVKQEQAENVLPKMLDILTEIKKKVDEEPIVLDYLEKTLFISLTNVTIEDNTAVLLWRIGDKNTVSPMFWDTEENHVRGVAMETNEVVGCSSHMVISLQSEDHSYIIIKEKTPDLTKARTQSVLNRIFKNLISHKLGEGGSSEFESSVRIELFNLPAKNISDIFRSGTGISFLARSRSKASASIDEAKGWITKYKEKQIKFLPEKVTLQEPFKFVTALFNKLREQKYDTVAIKYKENGIDRSCIFDIPEEFNYDETVFDRVEKIYLSKRIKQIEEYPHSELVAKIKRTIIDLEKKT